MDGMDSGADSWLRSQWDILGTEPTGDERAIKRAYASRLKVTRPEDDPAAFQLLRQAYEYALYCAGQEHEHAHGSPAPVLAGQAVTQGMASSSPDAVQLATQAFLAWRDNNHVQPLESLAALAASDAFLSFAVREQFERLALDYCASEICGDEERDALVEHFDWQRRFQHLEKINREDAHAAMGRFNAARSHEFLLYGDHQYRAALKVLLAPRPPAYSGLLGDKVFTRTVLELITRLHWQHPDFLAYRVNPEVLDWWERHASAKRYFVDTAVHSFIAGLALFVITLVCERLRRGEAIEHFTAMAFFGTQALAFATFAALALRPPRKLLAWLTQFKERHLDIYLHQRRYQAIWQLGWLVPFVLLSLPLFLPVSYRPLFYVLYLGLPVCTMLALFAASVVLRWYHMLLLIVVAFLSAVLMLNSGFRGYGSGVLFWFCICLLAQALRGGLPLFLASGWRPARLRTMRLAWLCSAPLVPLLIELDLLPPALATFMTWLWCLSGILLSRFTPSKLPPVMLIWPLLFLKGGWDHVRNYFNALPDMRLVFLLPLLLIVTIFMLTNMYHAEQDEHYFC